MIANPKKEILFEKNELTETLLNSLEYCGEAAEVISELIPYYKIFIGTLSVSDKLFYKKIEKFLKCTKDIPEYKKENFIKKSKNY